MLKTTQICFIAQHKNWEDLGPMKGRFERDSRRFKFAANHHSLGFPVQKKKEWCRMLINKKINDNDVCSGIVKNNNKITTSPWFKGDELKDKKCDKI